MIAASCPRKPFLYAYDLDTDIAENKADLQVLYSLATKSRPSKKVALFGGVHGANPSGVPAGQRAVEKPADASNPSYWQGSAVVAVGGVSVTSFALDEAAIKSNFKGLNFVYTSLGKYTSPGQQLSAEKQEDVLKLIKGYHDSNNYYVLLCWCYSRTWAVANGL